MGIIWKKVNLNSLQIVKKSNTLWKIWTLLLKLQETFNVIKKGSNLDVATAQDPSVENGTFSKFVS